MNWAGSGITFDFVQNRNWRGLNRNQVSQSYPSSFIYSIAWLVNLLLLSLICPCWWQDWDYNNASYFFWKNAKCTDLSKSPYIFLSVTTLKKSGEIGVGPILLLEAGPTCPHIKVVGSWTRNNCTARFSVMFFLYFFTIIF